MLPCQDQPVDTPVQDRKRKHPDDRHDKRDGSEDEDSEDEDSQGDLDSEALAAKLAVVNAKLALAKAQEALLLAKRKKNSRDGNLE